MPAEPKPIKAPLTNLPIKTAVKGFYDGFSVDVTVTAKVLVAGLILWAIAFPDHAGATLSTIKDFVLINFAAWYIYIMAFFVIFCLALAIWPASGRLKIGQDDDEPEFSRFSWFSMMFGAGIGVGMLTWAVAEPVYHIQNNPDVIQGFANSGNPNNLLNAYKWSYLNWGFSAWATYAVAGLGMGYFAYRRGLPLTVRSSLAPLFGSRLSGWSGHAIDVFAVIATILGVAQTIGLGVEQFVAGLSRITIMNGYLEGRLADAEGADMLLKSAREAAAVGKRLGVHRLNLHGTGLGDMGIPIPRIGSHAPETELRARDTLHRICDLGEEMGVVFTLENLNPIDHPGCPFGSTEAVLSLVSAVNRPQLRINLDLYHTQIGEGDLVRWCEACMPWIGEVQVADNPGRSEPGTGEINYRGIALALKGMGYSGPVGMEAFAKGDEEAALEAFRSAFTV